MAHSIYKQVKDFANKHRGFVKFLAVGGANTAVDFILYSVIANLFVVYPPLASIISTGLTLILSFFLNHHFVFRSQKKKRNVAVQFVTITLFNVWIIQTLIITLFIHSFGSAQFFIDHEWTLNTVAKLSGVAISFMLNFIGYRYIFKQKAENDKK